MNESSDNQNLDTDYRSEVSKIQKRGTPKKIAFIFIILALLIAFLLFRNIFFGNSETAEKKSQDPESSYQIKQRVFELPEEPLIIPQEEPIKTAENSQLVPHQEDTYSENTAPRKIIKSLSQGTIGNSLTNTPTDSVSEPSVPLPQTLEDDDLYDKNTTTFKPKKARKLLSNPNLLLAKGTFIQCALRTKIVSTIAGNVGCIISNDIYSANGSVLLIERGSTVFGEFQSGRIQQGEDRIFVVWTEIRTPHNVIIDVNSGATDELGGTGVPGWTDNHFWTRFGAAIMMSMITDTTGALASQLAKSDGFSPDNTVDTSGEVVRSILDKTVNIPPTLYKNQGDIVGIFVARDIDFSNVYELKKR